jgi:epoxyqueuosine reductase
MDMTAYRVAVTSRAEALGFGAVGFMNLPKNWDAEKGLRQFIKAGHHGEMQWMSDSLERRVHPQNMWDAAQSAIVLGYNYGPDPMARLSESHYANISVYARGDDYHDVIKKKLKQLAGDIVALSGAEVKVFVDTAPLMEKPLAQLAGLGWQGKHTNLVSREFGSWLFLGVILTNQTLADTPAEIDHCGSCQACLDICPTQAFVAPYTLDARACLSYLTIEFQGSWPVKYRKAMGNRVYGCDDCLAICPWNKFAQNALDIKLQARDGFQSLSLIELASLDDQAFRHLFSKSPIKRIGVGRFLRNVHYALGNHLSYRFETSGNLDVLTVLTANLGRENALVRASAIWALSLGLEANAFSKLRQQHYETEQDPFVRLEWDQAHA